MIPCGKLRYLLKDGDVIYNTIRPRSSLEYRPPAPEIKVVDISLKIELILSWRHSGFGLYCGDRTYSKDSGTMKNLVRYIIRASFSQERMKYFPEDSKLQIDSPKYSNFEPDYK